MEKVRLENITKRFGDVVAVDDVTLGCDEGEFLVLLGPSGSGKTTLLRLIAGLETATGGEITIAGRNVTNVPPKDRDIAMVFQHYALYPHMSVRKNLELALRRRKVPRDVISARTNEVVALLQIDTLLERLPRQLSGGQQQRVAVGRAIMREPQVFLMDEPLSNLDARLRMETRRELITLQRRLDGTFIYVTHDQNEAMTMGTRVAIMRDGVVQQHGRPFDVFRSPVNTFVAGFLGELKMNFLTADLVGADDRLAARGEDFEFELERRARAAASSSKGGKVILGVRPEHIDVDDGSGGGVIRGTVQTFEVMGSRALLTIVRGAGAVMSAEVSSTQSYEPGAEVALKMDWTEVHVFDAGTELRLGAPNV